MHGGGHEAGLRSGTLATHQITGMGQAFAIARQEMDEEHKRITKLRDLFWQQISSVPSIKLNGAEEPRVPNNLNICMRGIDAEALLMGLPHIAMSTSSACNSIAMQASYVLKAIGLSDEDALSSVRISFGRFTTEAEVLSAAKELCLEIQRLRDLAPND